MSPPVLISPRDAANERLRQNVAPEGYVAPQPQSRYHLVIVGAGTAGLVSASIAASLGAKVALVERTMFGGDCLNFGCVPSKAVIRAARAWQEAKAASVNFGGPTANNDGNFGRVMLRLRELRAEISTADSIERFTKLGVDVFLGDATFTTTSSVRVGNTSLNFRRAIIATGGRAATPPIPGLADKPFDTNESIFSITELPQRLIVIGGGPIGTELAQAFARFGSSVTVIHSDAHLLPREDRDAADIISNSLKREGVHIVNDARIERVSHASEFSVSYSSNGVSSTLTADRVLVATGRVPNVEGLGLENAKVEFTKAGVTVDDHFRTSNPRVFAIGDVSSAMQFTHLADAQARLAVPNALFFGIGGGRRSSLVVPRATYTSPEVAHVGITPEEAHKHGIELETVRVDLLQNDRSVLDGDTDGFLKVHLQRGTDKIAGATLVSAHAGELIAEAALAITNGIGLAKIGKTIHPYPTQSEVFRKAADIWGRKRLTSRARTFFSWWFRIFS